jgi:hypothetical protein
MRMIQPNFGTQDDTNGVDLEGFDLPLYQRPTSGEEVDAAEIGMNPGEVLDALESSKDTSDANSNDAGASRTGA